MTDSKIIARAKQLKAEGKTHMAAMLKRHYGSSYYNVQSIEDVLAAGKWIAAPYGQFRSGAHGRVGIESRKIDWAITARK